LLNQWQIIAAARHGKTAALAAPFKPKDAELFSIISGFDAAYTAYNGHQATMERYWTLKSMQQQGLAEIVGTLFREGLVRADAIPLVLPVLGGNDLPRGAHVRVKLGEIDLITLDVKGTVVERLDLPAEPEDAGDEGDDEPVAGPIAIAVDVNESEDSPAVAGDNAGGA
jgi:exoribonuclease-2